MYYLFLLFFCFFFRLLFVFFLCFFLLLLLLLVVGCHYDRRGRLPFLAGEVDCLFWQEVGCLFRQDFFRVVVILRACVRVAVAEILCSVTDLTKDESPHTGYTFTPWVVSFTPPSIEHQVGGSSILRLFRRTCREPWDRFSVSRLGSLAGVVTRNRVLNSGHPSKYWPCRMTA